MDSENEPLKGANRWDRGPNAHEIPAAKNPESVPELDARTVELLADMKKVIAERINGLWGNLLGHNASGGKTNMVELLQDEVHGEVQQQADQVHMRDGVRPEQMWGVVDEVRSFLRPLVKLTHDEVGELLHLEEMPNAEQVDAMLTFVRQSGDVVRGADQVHTLPFISAALRHGTSDKALREELAAVERANREQALAAERVFPPPRDVNMATSLTLDEVAQLLDQARAEERERIGGVIQAGRTIGEMQQRSLLTKGEVEHLVNTERAAERQRIAYMVRNLDLSELPYPERTAEFIASLIETGK
jgi:hypothetical protein